MNEIKLEIGEYKPNATKEESFYYVDDYGLVLINKENNGLGDCIGRTMRTYQIYNDPKLITAIENLWQPNPEYNNKIVGIRHPDMDDVDGKFASGYWKGRMSRDHYINTLVALKTWENRNQFKNKKLEEIVKATPFGIRKMARWTLGLILWSKALIGNKVALWFYLILELLTINLINLPIRKLADKLCEWETEMEQEEWELIQTDITQTNLQAQPKWKQRIDKIAYPSFAIQFSCNQLYVTPNTFPKLKRLVQKSLLKMVGETNYVQQMLLGKKNIPRDKVENFKAMQGSRWSGYLNNRNDRTMRVFPEGKYTANVQDVDLIRYLYNETQIGF